MVEFGCLIVRKVRSRKPPRLTGAARDAKLQPWQASNPDWRPRLPAAGGAHARLARRDGAAGETL